MTGVRWMLADLKTGDLIDELPLILNGQLERSVSKKMTSSVALPIHDRKCPPNWNNLLAAGRSMIVPVTDDEAATPLHSYLVTAVTPGGPLVGMTLTSNEVIPEADYCGDHDFYETDESRIIEALMAPLVSEFNLVMDVTDCGKTSDQTYSWYEDRTVASAISDLAGKRGGPEWTTRVRWADASQSRFEKVFEVGPQIGRRIESTVFDNRHLDVDGRTRPRDWTPGRGFATAVQATGDGSGESRPMSQVMVDQSSVDAGTPRWMMRVAATSLETEAELDEYAIAQLRRLRYGGQSWELTLNLNEPSCPQPVADFDAGDTVTMALDPTEDDPASWHGPARVIGWRMTAEGNELTKFTPVFWDPSELEDV